MKFVTGYISLIIQIVILPLLILYGQRVQPNGSDYMMGNLANDFQVNGPDSLTNIHTFYSDVAYHNSGSFIIVWDDNRNGDMSYAINKSSDGKNWITSDADFTLYDSFGREYFLFGSEINMFYSTLTDIEETHSNILNYSLSQNYPNPFNPSTTIKYQIPSNVKGETSNTKLIIYDILGREIATLVNEEQQAGSYEVQFDAGSLTSGIYLYRLQSGSFAESRKMILMK